jgi:hypothetical protein
MTNDEQVFDRIEQFVRLVPTTWKGRCGTLLGSFRKLAEQSVVENWGRSQIEAAALTALKECEGTIMDALVIDATDSPVA